jgi:hypothetical protein
VQALQPVSGRSVFSLGGAKVAAVTEEISVDSISNASQFKDLSAFQKFLFLSQIFSAVAALLGAIGTTLRLASEGRLSPARAPMPDSTPESVAAQTRQNSRSYFDI